MRQGLMAAALALLTTATATAEPRKLTLAEAVQMAMRVEPVVAEAHIAQDRAQLGVLRAQLDRVSLKIDGQVQELWNKVNIGGQPLIVDGMRASDSGWQGLSNLQATVNYYLFSGFRVEANVQRAKLQETAAIVQVKQQRKDTALLVARSYWQVRRLTILREVQEQSLQRMVDAEQVADARVKAGLAPPIDRNRATQRKLTLMATLESLAGQAKAAAAQLAVTLGTNDELELVDEPTIPETAPPSPMELVKVALDKRPEIAGARLTLAMQQQAVVMARSGFFPQLSLFGLFQYGNNPLNLGSGARNIGNVNAARPFERMTGVLTVGATLSMNFFDTLSTYTSTSDAHHQERLNQQEVRRHERLVDSDVRAAHANLLKLYSQRRPLLSSRDVARDNLTIIEGRYKNGDALIIEYLDAQIELANAELQLADVTAQLRAQWLELDAALGSTVGVDHG